MQLYQGAKCAVSLEYRLLVVEMRLNMIGLLLCRISSEAEIFGINFVFVDTVQHLMAPNVKPANLCY